MAGIAITAFSLLLYSLTFNLRVRVARSFSGILACLVLVYVAESSASVAKSPARLEFWLKAQWIGIVFLPSAYLHFSDAVLATTGKPSKGKRRWTIRLSYLISLVFLVSLFMGVLVGPLVQPGNTAPFLEPTWLTDAFMLYYVGAMLMSWYNFISGVSPFSHCHRSEAHGLFAGKFDCSLPLAPSRFYCSAQVSPRGIRSSFGW